ncbi:hypothetical protein E0K83_16825 [Gramella sp. BOM4]|nr:hypothetical protein [Christiangramia bathymodioli]
MNRVIIFLFILLSFSSCSQKWTFEEKQSNKEFPFHYTLSFKNTEDKSKIKLQKIEDTKDSKLLLQIVDNNIVGIPGVRIKIISQINQSTIDLNTNNDGKISVKLEPGEYLIKVSSSSFDDFRSGIKILKNSTLTLKIELFNSKKFIRYVVHSKEKLSEKLQNQIFECVKNGHYTMNFSPTECSESSFYKVFLEI